MEAVVSTPTPTPPAAPPMPAVESTPAAPPVNNAMYEPAPIMQEGGKVSSGGFFQSLNWLEVGFGILGVAALLYAIQYYRFKIREDKMVNNQLQRQIDEVKMNLQGAMKGKYKSI